MYKILDEKIFDNSAVSEPFVSFNSSKPLDEFDCVQKLVEIKKGIVMPRLNESYVHIVNVEPHDFNSDRPLVEAQLWAECNLVNSYVSHIGTRWEFSYKISRKAIKKYIQSSNESENIAVHLSVLKLFPKIIDASIEVEIHADYAKGDNGRSSDNYVNKNILIHRFYGAIKFLDKLYRVKTTIKEYKQPDMFLNKPYSFEVIKIVLLDESNSTILGTKVADSNESSQLSATNLLQNVEKSYDKGKFLLEESKKDEENYNSVIFWH